MEMIGLAEFRELVDRTRAGIEQNTDPRVAKRYAGLEAQGNYTRTMVSGALSERIRNALPIGHQKVFAHFSDLIRQLVIANEATDAARDPYYEILRTIKDAARSDGLVTPHITDWEAAVQAAVDHAEWMGPFYVDRYEQVNQADIATGGAYKRLRGIGASGKHDLVSPEQNRVAVAKSIEKLVIHMGGIEVVRRLTDSLKPTFDAGFGRYLNREPHSFAEQMQPMIPYGFLLNMAAKHPIPRKPLRRSERDWTNLIEISRDFGSLYGVQSPTYVDNMLANETTLLPLMRRLALRDSLFFPAQARLSDVIKILTGILHELSAREDVAPEAVVEAQRSVEVLRAMLSLVGEQLGPVRLKESAIQEACKGCDSVQVSAILAKVLAHPAGTCNAKFSFPEEVPDDSLPREQRSGPNFGDRPLLLLESGEFVLLSASFCGPAMIEAVLTQLRNAGINDVVGLAVEDFLITEVQRLGIPVASGKYLVDKKIWECDLVIEAPGKIILVEMKKKSLTRAARAGLDTELLINMAESMLGATVQAMRHEVKLRIDDLVLNQKDGTTKTVELNGREVERIAVTLPDYGGFQDRMLLEQLLQTQMRLDFSTTNPASIEKIGKLNKRLKELRALNVRLYDLADKPRNWNSFSHSWFLSVPQVLMLLDGVDSAGALEQELSRIRRVTTGQKDFYLDLHYVRDLQARKGQPDQGSRMDLT